MRLGIVKRDSWKKVEEVNEMDDSDLKRDSWKRGL